MDLINQINLSNKFVRPIKPINRLIQTQHDNNIATPKNSVITSILLYYKIERFLARNGVLVIRHLLHCCILGETS